MLTIMAFISIISVILFLLMCIYYVIKFILSFRRQNMYDEEFQKNKAEMMLNKTRK